MPRNPATDPREGDTWVNGAGVHMVYLHVDLVTDDKVYWRLVDRLDALTGARCCTRDVWLEACRSAHTRYMGNATEAEK
jgi:hypothetical protein